MVASKTYMVADQYHPNLKGLGVHRDGSIFIPTLDAGGFYATADVDEQAIIEKNWPTFLAAAPFANYAAMVASLSPTQWLKLDEASGVPQDSSGNSNNANTLAAATYRAAGPGSGGSLFGISFTTAQKLTRTSAIQIGTGSFSWSAWVKTSQTTIGTLHRNSAATGGWNCDLNSGATGRFRVTLFNNANSTIPVQTAAGAVPTDGTWHHVAWTLDRSVGTVRLYVDGVLSAGPTSVTATLSNAENNATTGADDFPGQTGSAFAGSLSNIVCANALWTDSQVSRLQRYAAVA